MSIVVSMDMRTVESHLYKLLVAEQEKRKDRSGKIEGVLEWIVLERQLMIDTVQQMRKEEHLEPAPVEDILRAEREACGHSDYTKKFARYCAEIVVDGKLLRTIW